MSSGTAKHRAPESIGVELTAEQQEYIFSSILENKPYTQIGRELKIPPHWIADYSVKDPIFAKKIRAIREIWMHSQVQSLIGITQGCNTMAEVSAAKVESENIKWSASKLIPAVYADNLNVNVSHHLDLSSILLAAENRVLPLLQAKNALNHQKPAATIDRGEAIDIQPIPETVSIATTGDVINELSIPHALATELVQQSESIESLQSDAIGAIPKEWI